jgi:hypothetical protein
LLQSGLEDHGYARRIALLRSHYFDDAPEVTPYLLSVLPEKHLQVERLWAVRGHELRSVTGMVGVVTAVLAGSTLGLVVAVASGIRLRSRRDRNPGRTGNSPQLVAVSAPTLAKRGLDTS